MEDIKVVRRIRRYEIIPEVLVNVFRTGVFMEIIDGIPNDAVFKGFAHDYERNTLVVFMEHPSFDPVPDSHVAPRGPEITMKTFDKPVIQVFKKFMASVKGVHDGSEY